jgi:hypothetical protein
VPRASDLVAHFLDPSRRPPRVKQWSIRHRDEQTRYCSLYVLPVIADIPCRELTRDDLQLILDKTPTKSVASHIKSCISGFVNAGLDEGHLLARQDLLRGLRWRGIDDTDRDDEPADQPGGPTDTVVFGGVTSGATRTEAATVRTVAAAPTAAAAS